LGVCVFYEGRRGSFAWGASLAVGAVRGLDGTLEGRAGVVDCGRGLLVSRPSPVI